MSPLNRGRGEVKRVERVGRKSRMIQQRGSEITMNRGCRRVGIAVGCRTGAQRLSLSCELEKLRTTRG